MSTPRKLVRRDAAPKSESGDDGISEIYFQHADGTVDKNDAPDVIGGVVYPKNPDMMPVHFTRPVKD